MTANTIAQRGVTAYAWLTRATDQQLERLLPNAPAGHRIGLCAALAGLLPIEIKSTCDALTAAAAGKTWLLQRHTIEAASRILYRLVVAIEIEREVSAVDVLDLTPSV